MIPEEEIPADRNIQIHDTELQTYAEEEHALIGIIEGAEVSVDRGPWIKPGPDTVIEDVRDPYDRNYKW